MEFVTSYNLDNGYGGQTAASKKFMISLPTVSSWMRVGFGVGEINIASNGGPIAIKLAKLQSIHSRIVKLEFELTRLRAKFNTLKKAL